MIDFIKNLLVAVWLIISKTVNFIINVLIKIVKFLGPEINSIRGKINPEELYRVIILSSSSTGSVYATIRYLYNNIDKWINDPALSTGIQAFISTLQHDRIFAVIFIIVFSLDFCRRKYGHGEDIN